MRKSSSDALGSVFRRVYKDQKTGKLKKVATYTIAYPFNGVEKRESTGTAVFSEARALLKKRLSGEDVPAAANGERFTIESLFKLIEADYRDNNKNSIRTQKRSRFPHLRAYFGDRDISNLKKKDTEDYRRTRLGHTIAKGPRKGKPYSRATVNRELDTLHHGMRLACEAELVAFVPPVKKLPEATPRTGFFEREDFERVLEKVDPWWVNLFEVAYIMGWRVDDELCPLRWSQVDFDNGYVRLEHGTTKNNEGRNFPMVSRLRRILLAQREQVRKLEITLGRIIPSVFPIAAGRKLQGHALRSAYKAFKSAAIAAGLGDRIVHDFRRTAVRNLELAGVDRRTAMAMVGHKTESVYARYNIVDAKRLEAGKEKFEKFDRKLMARKRSSERE